MFENMNILNCFFVSPTREFSVREIARLCDISPATSSAKLKELAKEDILTMREDRQYLVFKANLESSLYRDMKVFYNIRMIKESGLLDEIDDTFLRPTVVLFGSAAYGLDTETSDIDLYIQAKEKKVNLEKFEKKLKREIHMITGKKIMKNLINEIINGIVIQGKLTWT